MLSPWRSRRAELHICRVEIFLPALWSHRIAKKGLIFARHKPVVSRFLLIGPTDWQILRRSDPVIDDRPVPHGRPNYLVASAQQRQDQVPMMACMQNYMLLVGDTLSHCSFQPRASSQQPQQTRPQTAVTVAVFRPAKLKLRLVHPAASASLCK